MAGLYLIEIEPEVRKWLESLKDHDFGRVDFYASMLAEKGDSLDEPYSRHLRGKVRELRFYLGGQQTRITYWLGPGRRVILLTVFPKTRPQEEREISRAVRAQRECESAHLPGHDWYDRDIPEEK